MVVAEHLDWHRDVDDYKFAKSQVFKHQKNDDIAIYFSDSDNSKQIVENSPGAKIPYYSPPGAYMEGDEIKIEKKIIVDTKDIKLLGEHNWQNICAAVTAVWQTGVKDIEATREVIKSFSGLKLRLELVRELAGVKYYNDSFGTTPETAIVAIKAFPQPKILIAGGSDKGVSFDGLSKTIANENVKVLIAIGNTGKTIADQVRPQNSDIEIIEDLSKMPEIVSKAHELAKEGDVVLLSCGSASFGLFKNYKDRGEQFNQAVEELP